MILGNPITLGGGGTKAFAVIGVTYPEGSTCTCSDGTKILKLKDTSGQGIFLIPYAATWIVTATDGASTNSETVEITSEGQSVSVKLIFGIWLYKDGEEYMETTGGWALATIGSGSQGSSLTKNAESMTFKTSFVGGSHFAYGFLRANNKIDVTDFSTIKAFLSGVNIGANIPIYLCASIEDLYNISDTALGYMKSYVSITNDGEIMLDVTALTGEYYIGFAAGAGDNDFLATITVERVGCE